MTEPETTEQLVAIDEVLMRHFPNSTSGERIAAAAELAGVIPGIPPGPCFDDPGVEWPDGHRPRCELRAGHAGAHECGGGSFGGTAVWEAGVTRD